MTLSRLLSSDHNVKVQTNYSCSRNRCRNQGNIFWPRVNSFSFFFFIWIIVYYFIYTITNFCHLQAYKHRAKEIGFDEYHAFLRAVSFDFAQAKPEAEMQSALITLVTEDDSRVDR